MRFARYVVKVGFGVAFGTLEPVGKNRPVAVSARRPAAALISPVAWRKTVKQPALTQTERGETVVTLVAVVEVVGVAGAALTFGRVARVKHNATEKVVEARAKSVAAWAPHVSVGVTVATATRDKSSPAVAL